MTDPARPWTAQTDGAAMAVLASLGLRPVGVVVGTAIAPLPSYQTLQQVARSAPATKDPPGTASRRRPGRPVGPVVDKSYPCPHPDRAPGTGHRAGRTLEYSDPSLTYRRRAIDTVHDRLIDEARDLGAHGVIGVRLRSEAIGTGAGARLGIQWQRTGTAVRASGTPDLATPFTAQCDVAELVALLQIGRVPVRVVVGLGTVMVASGCSTTMAFGSTTPSELDQIGEAPALAVAVARAELAERAGSCGAQEVVGVSTAPPELATVSVAAVMSISYVDAVMLGTAVRIFEPEARIRKARTVYGLET